MLFSPCDQYVDDLKGAWRSLIAKGHRAPHEVTATLEKETVSFTWADLFALERAVLEAEPDDQLRRHAWIIRDRYRSIAGEQQFKAYEASRPPDAASASQSLLRADLEVLLSETQYLLLFQPPRERLRSLLTLIAYGLIVVALLFALAGGPSFFQWASHRTISIVFFLGWVGGVLSVIQRIQSLPEGDPLFRMSLVRAGWFALIFSPIAGGAFAVILYFVFIAQLLKGPAFPVIDTPDHRVSLAIFASAIFGTDGTNPHSGADWAKLLIWSFLAGFAERLVPDQLTRIAGAAKSTS
jgi:hypothetical protein